MTQAHQVPVLGRGACLTNFPCRFEMTRAESGRFTSQIVVPKSCPAYQRSATAAMSYDTLLDSFCLWLPEFLRTRSEACPGHRTAGKGRVVPRGLLPTSLSSQARPKLLILHYFYGVTVSVRQLLRDHLETSRQHAAPGDRKLARIAWAVLNKERNFECVRTRAMPSRLA